MRYYIDTEFNELGHHLPVELISIGVKAQDGREYYAVAADGWQFDHCSPWVRENVLPHLGGPWKTRKQIAKDLLEFCVEIPCDTTPEFWGYFADYDWVLFCQLWGTMMDLPAMFPNFCMDLKQSMKEHCIEKKQMPQQEGVAHNALEDARHMKVMHDFIYADPYPSTAGDD